MIAKLDMDDGLPGSIWIDEAGAAHGPTPRRRRHPRCHRTDSRVLGVQADVPVPRRRSGQGVREGDAAGMCGRPCGWSNGRTMGVYPYRVSTCWRPRPAVRADRARNANSILLGGITDREHLETGLRERIRFSGDGAGACCASPDRVNTMMAEPASRSRCNHNNKCMVTVFGPHALCSIHEQRYGAVLRAEPDHLAPGWPLVGPGGRYRASASSARKPWMPPSKGRRAIGTPAASRASA